MNLHNLFPTPVAFFKTSITDDEKSFIAALDQTPNSGNTTSKNNYLFRAPEMQRLAAEADGCLSEYMKTVYAPKFDVNPYVTQSWANYTNPGQHHHKHAHPNSFVSGCIYISAKADRIYFFKEGYQQIKVPTDNFNVYNSESWWLEVNEGDIILFPSSLVHMVETLGDKETRISLSFNTFLRGKIGDPGSLTELEI
jgi:uncharacterized protein (TIGR02466 family)